MAREVTVSTPQDGLDVGGCNGCTEHFEQHGTNAGSQVFEVRLRSMSLRLCFKCARELRRRLRQRLEEANEI